MSLAGVGDFLETSIQAVLHIVAQWLMIPVMIILIALVVYALVCIGSIIVEWVTERRLFKDNSAVDINAVYDATYENVASVIAGTSLLGPQKDALEIIANNMGLSDDDLYALAKAEIGKVDDRYQKIVKRTDLVTKISPMMGLMCTLIPLGPGIVAIGTGDMNTLSNSLLVAFDGTVAGLLSAVVSMCVSNVRKRWYKQYLTAIEALMTSVLEKAEEAHKEHVTLPHNFTEEELEQCRKTGFGSKVEKGASQPERPVLDNVGGSGSASHPATGSVLGQNRESSGTVEGVRGVFEGRAGASEGFAKTAEEGITGTCEKPEGATDGKEEASDGQAS